MVGTDYDRDPTRNLNIEIDIQMSWNALIDYICWMRKGCLSYMGVDARQTIKKHKKKKRIEEQRKK